MANEPSLSGMLSWKNPITRLVVVLFTIVIVGFSTVSNYGVSWDESSGIATVKWNYDYIKHKSPMPEEVLKYNGTIFNFAAEIVYQATNLISKPFVKQPSASAPIVDSVADQTLSNSNSTTENQISAIEIAAKAQQDRRLDQEILARIKVKHPFTFFTSLITYISVAGIVTVLCGLQYAWIGPIVLASFPRFWGHSFFNHKDIPFAAVFTLGIFAGTYLVNQYLQIRQETKLFAQPLLINAALFGILAGVLAGVRLGGTAIIAITYIAYLIVRLGLPRKRLYRDILQVSIYHGITLLICLIITVVCYPTSWANPVKWLFEAGTTIAKYPWSGVVLFNGNIYPNGLELPWYYIPVWFFITVPIILQVAFVFGLLLTLKQYRKFSPLQKACAVLIVLQIFLIPVLVILKGSVTYNGIRHFLFTFPGVAVLATISIVWLYQRLNQRSLKLAGIAFAVVLFSQIRWDMTRLHPYESVYFNHLSRSIAGTPNNYETDYWGLSAREGMEWINQHGTSGLPVLIGVQVRSASIYADSDVEYVRFSDPNIEYLLKNSKSFYYLAPKLPSYSPNYQYHDRFQQCPLVHQVIRQDIPLTLVRQCSTEAGIEQ